MDSVSDNIFLFLFITEMFLVFSFLLFSVSIRVYPGHLLDLEQGDEDQSLIKLVFRHFERLSRFSDIKTILLYCFQQLVLFIDFFLLFWFFIAVF